MEPQVRAMVQGLGLERRVRLLGTLPHAEVIRYYQQAHCFVLASKVAADGDRDGIPNVLVEAMAVGVPVISTRVSAIPELVADGVTGTLVEAEDPRAMAGAIKAVLLHPERARDQVRRARLRVDQDFDNRRCILRLHALLRDALEDAGARSKKQAR